MRGSAVVLCDPHSLSRQMIFCANAFSVCPSALCCVISFGGSLVGALPVGRRGQAENALITAWDWLATYVHGVARADPTDKRAALAGLPPIDSIDMLPLILGTNGTAARTEVIVGDTSALNPNGDGETLVRQST